MFGFLGLTLGISTIPFVPFVERKIKINFFKERNGFGPKKVYCQAFHTSLSPAVPVDTVHNVLRPLESGDAVALEGDGLLNVTLKFQVAERKSLGVRTKSRIFSTLYQIRVENLKEILNTGIEKELGRIDPVNVPYYLGSVTQTFTGTFNGRPFEIEISKDEFGPAFSTQGDDFIYCLAYKIFDSWKDDVTNSNASAGEKAKVSSSLVNIDRTDYNNSTGLELICNLTDLFTKGFTKTTPFEMPDLKNTQAQRGRNPKKTAASSVSIPTTTVNDNHFNAFTKLPVSVGFVEPNVVLGTTNLPLTHTLLIESRRTDFTLYFLDLQKAGEMNVPFTFSYYEDGEHFERCFVNADFLGAAIHKALLQYVEQTHSSRIVYSSLVFDSFEKKQWNKDYTLCLKNSMSEFGSVEVFFNLNTIGCHLAEVVNYKANLQFLTRFKKTTTNFFVTNRVISCTAFSTQAEAADANYKPLMLALERALISPIILCEKPLVMLTPAFERGQTIEIANAILFRGLVSNASSIIPSSPTFPSNG